MESALRPRDIQARIRAGESPEAVAEAAGAKLERVMAFAGPVLDERAWVAQQGQAASVRRRTADPRSARTLAESSAVLFADLGVRQESVEWDAWRREDGRWVLVADYTVKGEERHAEFLYDPRGRYVSATNPEAKLLTGETQVSPAGQASPDKPVRRRLTAVGEQDELPLGDDALELVRERPPLSEVPTGDDPPESDDPGAAVSDLDQPLIPENEPLPSDVEPTIRRKIKLPAIDDPEFETADADWLTVHESDVHSPQEPQQVEPTAAPAPAAESTAGQDLDSAADQPDDSEPAAEEPAPSPKKKATRRKRASVPSWDEIMFGGSERD